MTECRCQNNPYCYAQSQENVAGNAVSISKCLIIPCSYKRMKVLSTRWITTDIIHFANPESMLSYSLLWNVIDRWFLLFFCSPLSFRWWMSRGWSSGLAIRNRQDRSSTNAKVKNPRAWRGDTLRTLFTITSSLHTAFWPCHDSTSPRVTWALGKSLEMLTRWNQVCSEQRFFTCSSEIAENTFFLLNMLLSFKFRLLLRKQWVSYAFHFLHASLPEKYPSLTFGCAFHPRGHRWPHTWLWCWK